MLVLQIPLRRLELRKMGLKKGLAWEPAKLLTRASRPFRARDLGTFRPGTEVSPKESEKSPKGCPGPPAAGEPEAPKSAPRSPKRVQKESEAAFFDSFRTPGRTLAGLWGSLGPEGPGHPFGLFSDSFGVLGPKGPGDLCARPGVSQPEKNLI